jgi:hypothetical protein
MLSRPPPGGRWLYYKKKYPPVCTPYVHTIYAPFYTSVPVWPPAPPPLPHYSHNTTTRLSKQYHTTITPLPHPCHITITLLTATCKAVPHHHRSYTNSKPPPQHYPNHNTTTSARLQPSHLYHNPYHYYHYYHYHTIIKILLHHYHSHITTITTPLTIFTTPRPQFLHYH